MVKFAKGKLFQDINFILGEPLHQRTNILYMQKQRRENKGAFTAQLISAFVFAAEKVHLPILSKSEISIFYISVCVGHDQ